MKNRRGSLILPLIATLMVISLLANVTSAWYVDSENIAAQFTAGTFDVKVKIGEGGAGQGLSFISARPMAEDAFDAALQQDPLPDGFEEVFQRVVLTNNGTCPARFILALEAGEIPEGDLLPARPNGDGGLSWPEDDKDKLECHNDLEKVLRVKLYDADKKPLQGVDLMAAPYQPQEGAEAVLAAGESRTYYLGGYLPENTPPYLEYTDADGNPQVDMYNGGHYHGKLAVLAWQSDEGISQPQVPEAPDPDRLVRMLNEENSDCPLGVDASHIIRTAVDLDHIRDHMDCSFVLANDIDLSDSPYASGWTPLGAPEEDADQGEFIPYTGTFDGNGHTISGMLVEGLVRTDTDGKILYAEPYGGLFSQLAGGTIENLHVEGAVTGGSTSGLLVGSNNGTIMNCSASGSVHAAAEDSGVWRLGGITGWNEAEGVLENVHAFCEISAKGQWAGGIAGQNDGVIQNAYAEGNVSGAFIGGLVGYNEGSAGHCYTTVRLRTVGDAAGHPLIGENSEDAQADSASLFFQKGNFYKDDALTAEWDDDTSLGFGKTAEELQLAATFDGWDTAVWKLAEGEYPTLRRVS